MVEDAETHAEEDRKTRELVDARNQAEARSILCVRRWSRRVTRWKKMKKRA